MSCSVCLFGDSVAKGVVFDSIRKKYRVIKDCFAASIESEEHLAVPHGAFRLPAHCEQRILAGLRPAHVYLVPGHRLAGEVEHALVTYGDLVIGRPGCDGIEQPQPRGVACIGILRAPGIGQHAPHHLIPSADPQYRDHAAKVRDRVGHAG